MAKFAEALADVVKGATLQWGSTEIGGAPDTLLRGKRFLDKAGHLNPSENLLGICKAYNEFLASDGWKWEPLNIGNTPKKGVELLDGTAGSGECAFVAWSLAILLQAPAPWGFRKGSTVPDMDVVTYSGEKKGGFISVHPKGIALPGAEPTVTDLKNGRTNLRYWDNHKVVSHKGAYWDACYQTRYSSLHEMAQISLERIAANKKPKDLKDYTGITGTIKSLGLAISDSYYNNFHSIDVFRSVDDNCHDAELKGYWINWQQTWGQIPTLSSSIDFTGPFKDNPLV